MTQEDIDRLIDIAEQGRRAVMDSAYDAGVRLDSDVADVSLDGNWPVVKYTLTVDVPYAKQTVGTVSAKIEDVVRNWWKTYTRGRT